LFTNPLLLTTFSKNGYWLTRSIISRWHPYPYLLHNHQHNSMQLVRMGRICKSITCFIYNGKVTQVCKWSKSPLYACIPLGFFRSRLPCSSSFVHVISSTLGEYFFHFFGNTHLLKHHGLFQTHIHFHVLERETPKFPRITNLSSSPFYIFSIPIFLTQWPS